jgi:hypothetical protein
MSAAGTVDHAPVFASPGVSGRRSTTFSAVIAVPFFSVMSLCDQLVVLYLSIDPSDHRNPCSARVCPGDPRMTVAEGDAPGVVAGDAEGDTPGVVAGDAEMAERPSAAPPPPELAVLAPGIGRVLDSAPGGVRAGCGQRWPAMSQPPPVATRTAQAAAAARSGVSQGPGR